MDPPIKVPPTTTSLTMDMDVTYVEEEDVEHLVRFCETPAFRNSNDPLGPMLFPTTFHTPTEEEIQWSMKLLSQDLKNKIVRKISLPDGMPIGYAVWSLNEWLDENGSKQEPNIAPEMLYFEGVAHKQWYPSTLNLQAWKDIGLDQYDEYWRVCDGRKSIYLIMLVVDPAYQTLGAGGRLIQDGILVAEDIGADIFAIASAPAVELHEKFGFKVTGALKTPGLNYKSMLREYKEQEG